MKARSAPDAVDAEEDDAEAIAREIDHTRAELAHTLDELQERLSPSQLVDRMVVYARNNVGEFAANLGNSVKRKPLPVLLTGIGLLWTMAARETAADPVREGDLVTPGSLPDVTTTTGEAPQSADGVAAQAVDTVRDTLSQAARQTSDKLATASQKAAALARDTGAQALRLRAGFQRLLEEQPMTVGALGLALGALIGAALPGTETEDRWLGEASDRTRAQAKQQAGEQPAGAQHGL